MKDFWNKHKKLMLGVFVVIGIALVAAVSYAYLKFTAIQTDNNKISTLCLNLKLEEVEGSGINLQETYPISEEQGQRLTPYTFTITNTCKNVTPYQVNLDILTDLTQESSLGLEYIRASLNKEASKLLSSYPTTEKTVEGSTTSKELTRGELSHNESITYELRLWMDERTTADEGASKEFSSKIVVTATTVFPEYKEEILNGTDPVLKEGLIPVTISDDGTVKVAELSEEWYSYANQRWANAVILNEGKKAEDYTDNIIPESDIESYFVWIPKYRYKLWDLGNYNSVVNGTPTESKAKEIEVVFGIENTENINGESCVTPMTSGATGECNVGEYMTHPAFISLGVKGLWVGKFETGYKGATTTAEAQQNIYDSSKVNIKPNVYSWRNSTVNNMFKTSYNYNRELNSHMMKNTEWGAVAYLSHSKYGINKEININNNSAYLTGYSAVVGTDQSSYPGTYGTDTSKTLPYNTSTGYLASTTGNITGIYDMSGGANEYVSAYMSGKIGSSGFNDATNVAYVKYIDVYNASSAIQTYQYRILGDATGEMGPFLLYKDRDGNSRDHNNWYADSSSFVESSGTWFRRSGNHDYGILAGQFNFARSTGAVNSYLGFRLVLAIQ